MGMHLYYLKTGISLPWVGLQHSKSLAGQMELLLSENPMSEVLWRTLIAGGGSRGTHGIDNEDRKHRWERLSGRSVHARPELCDSSSHWDWLGLTLQLPQWHRDLVLVPAPGNTRGLAPAHLCPGISSAGNRISVHRTQLYPALSYILQSLCIANVSWADTWPSLTQNIWQILRWIKKLNSIKIK